MLIDSTWVKEQGGVNDNSKISVLSTWKDGTAINWVWRLKGENAKFSLGQVFKSVCQLDFQVEKGQPLDI